MIFLFPDYALQPSKVDPDFAAEQAAALEAGFEVALYSHEASAAGDVAKAVRRCPPRDHPSADAILRGWMLTAGQFARLYAALSDRGYLLVNSPASYEEAHYLPLAYPKLQGHTPQSLWTEGRDIDQAWGLYQQLRDGHVILKDQTRNDSAAPWRCSSPSAATLFERRFVLRRYVPLVTRGQDMRGYPVAKERRLFFFDGRVLLDPVMDFAPPFDRMACFTSLAQRFESRFMTMDVAQTEAGGWIVIEVGDGGVSGLPTSLVEQDFYAALAERLRKPD